MLIPLVLLAVVVGFMLAYYFPGEPEGPAPTPVTVVTTLTPEGMPRP